MLGALFLNLFARRGVSLLVAPGQPGTAQLPRVVSGAPRAMRRVTVSRMSWSPLCSCVP
jgi:hypothetical protein